MKGLDWVWVWVSVVCWWRPGDMAESSERNLRSWVKNFCQTTTGLGWIQFNFAIISSWIHLLSFLMLPVECVHASMMSMCVFVCVPFDISYSLLTSHPVGNISLAPSVKRREEGTVPDLTLTPWRCNVLPEKKNTKSALLSFRLLHTSSCEYNGWQRLFTGVIKQLLTICMSWHILSSNDN